MNFLVLSQDTKFGDTRFLELTDTVGGKTRVVGDVVEESILNAGGHCSLDLLSDALFTRTGTAVAVHKAMVDGRAKVAAAFVERSCPIYLFRQCPLHLETSKARHAPWVYMCGYCLIKETWEIRYGEQNKQERVLTRE